MTLIITNLSDVSASLLAIGPAGSNPALLSISGEPYERYRIEASEDLRTWMPLTNFVLTESPLGFLDVDASNYSRRFYRAAEVTPAALIAAPLYHPARQFEFNAVGDPGRTFSILASTNLSDWSLLTHLVLTNAVTPFLDLQATNFPARFYRAVYP